MTSPPGGGGGGGELIFAQVLMLFVDLEGEFRARFKVSPASAGIDERFKGPFQARFKTRFNSQLPVEMLLADKY